MEAMEELVWPIAKLWIDFQLEEEETTAIMDVDVVEDTMMTITINKVVTFQRYFGETEKAWV